MRSRSPQCRFAAGRTFLQSTETPANSTTLRHFAVSSAISWPYSADVIGLYVGRIYAEAKGRPLYIVERAVGFEEAPTAARRPAAIVS